MRRLRLYEYHLPTPWHEATSRSTLPPATCTTAPARARLGARHEHRARIKLEADVLGENKRIAAANPRTSPRTA